jgi:hypothetical protein
MNKTEFRASLKSNETTVIDRQGNTVTVTDLMAFLDAQTDYKLHEIGRRTYLVTPTRIEPQRFGLEESFIVLLALQQPKHVSQISVMPETSHFHIKQTAGL